MSDQRKPVSILIGGIEHTLLLDDDDAKRYKAAEVEPVSEPVVTKPADAEPAGNASRDDWAKFAVDIKGAQPDDLLDGDGKELGRDELKDKFGTPSLPKG